jgi:hypothetical protein
VALVQIPQVVEFLACGAERTRTGISKKQPHCGRCDRAKNNELMRLLPYDIFSPEEVLSFSLAQEHGRDEILNLSITKNKLKALHTA